MSFSIFGGGGTSIFTNQLDYLYLFSNDLILSKDNKNIGNDLLRRIVGTFYYYADDPRFSAKKSIRVDTTTTLGAVNLMDRTIYRVPPADCEQVQYSEVNYARIQIIDKNVDIPNLKIPVRVYADKDNHSVKGDYHWKQFLFGGEYGGETLPKRLNSERIYYDASFALPYAFDYRQQREYEYFNREIKPYQAYYNIFSNYKDYNHNVQKYQDWSQDLESELLMPNFYIINDYFHQLSEMWWRAYYDLYGYAVESEKSLVVREQLGYVDNKTKITQYHFPEGNYFRESELDKAGGDYFGTYFTETSKNSEFKSFALNGLQNIILDQNYFNFIKDDLTIKEGEPFIQKGLEQNLPTFFNVEIKFNKNGNQTLYRDYPDIEASGEEYDIRNLKDSGLQYQKQTMRQLIKESNFSAKMLEMLKDIDEGTITDIPKRRLPFNYVITKDHLQNFDGTFKRISERPDEPVGLSSVNFMDFLSYAYNNYDVALNDNYIFAGPAKPAAAATMSDDTLYRTLNSTSLIKVIDGTKDLMKSYMSEFDPNDPTTSIDIRNGTYRFFNKLYNPNLKFNEVLAYKVEKIGGQVDGDSSTQNVIQKFWVFNSPDAPEDISIFDSQVKYGKDYTYKITAYTLVLTHKYKYDDFRITKQIGTGDYLSETDGREYCLQFYDTETNMVAPQLFASNDLTLSDTDPRRTVVSGMNSLAPNSVEISRHPQLLDFHLYFEPCFKLIEVPVYQKTIKVMDSPCNSINVVPFHFIDNSNRVGFQVNQESFIKRPYPEIIDSVDLKNKMDYLATKDLHLFNTVELISQSPARYIEMYRTKNKPNSFADFKDSLVATVDLRIKNEHYNFKNKMVSDQINPNTLYYYVFRFVNENGIPGPLSQIIQCELVNDGGYTYALFDTVDSSEFNPNQVTTNSLSVKKIMQLDPNIRQLYFDDSDVDYEDYAHNQIDSLIVGTSDSQIWDKKFKIRLTSKKTSKKIDLNVSYDLVQRNLSKIDSSLTAPTGEFRAMAGYFVEEGIPSKVSLDNPPIVLDELPELGDTTTIGDAGSFGFTSAPSTLGTTDIHVDTSMRDALVTADDLKSTYRAYLTSEGRGFPVTLYQFLANANYPFTEATVNSSDWFRDIETGYDFIYNRIRYHSETTRLYTRNDATFESVVRSTTFPRAICEWVYARRNAARLLAPMSKELAIVSALYMLNLVPAAHKAYYPGGVGYGNAKINWTNNGPEFTYTKNRILYYFNGGNPEWSDPNNYHDFDGSSKRPEDFSMATLLEYLKQDPSMFDSSE